MGWRWCRGRCCRWRWRGPDPLAPDGGAGAGDSRPGGGAGAGGDDGGAGRRRRCCGGARPARPGSRCRVPGRAVPAPRRGVRRAAPPYDGGARGVPRPGRTRGATDCLDGSPTATVEGTRSTGGRPCRAGAGGGLPALPGRPGSGTPDPEGSGTPDPYTTRAPLARLRWHGAQVPGRHRHGAVSFCRGEACLARRAARRGWTTLTRRRHRPHLQRAPRTGVHGAGMAVATRPFRAGPRHARVTRTGRARPTPTGRSRSLAVLPRHGARAPDPVLGVGHRDCVGARHASPGPRRRRGVTVQTGEPGRPQGRWGTRTGRRGSPVDALPRPSEPVGQARLTPTTRSRSSPCRRSMAPWGLAATGRLRCGSVGARRASPGPCRRRGVRTQTSGRPPCTSIRSVVPWAWSRHAPRARPALRAGGSGAPDLYGTGTRARAASRVWARPSCGRSGDCAPLSFDLNGGRSSTGSRSCAAPAGCSRRCRSVDGPR